jgi:hypothetical protein
MGRHGYGLTPEDLDWLVEGEAESGDLDSRDAQATDELIALAAQFDTAVDASLEEWVSTHPLAADYDVSDLTNDGASYLILMTLRGEGVGIWDGDWDHYFRGGSDEIDKLSDFLKRSLGAYADEGSGGSLDEALRDAAYETAG